MLYGSMDAIGPHSEGDMTLEITIYLSKWRERRHAIALGDKYLKSSEYNSVPHHSGKYK